MKSVLTVLSAAAILTLGNTARLSATTHHSPKGYQIMIPTGWTPNTSGMLGSDFILFRSPVVGFKPNINVVVVKANPSEDLNASANAIHSTFAEMFTDYKERFHKVTQQTGRPAVESEGTYVRANGQAMWIHQYVVVTHKYDYVFTLTGDVAGHAKYEAAFRRVMSSLKIH